MKRTLLVTGGAGFIGSNFVEMTVKRGDRVIVLDALTYAGHRENLEGISGPGSFELVIGDICDGKLVAKLLRDHQVDWLINFAAESHVDRSIDSPSTFIETNIRGTFNLLNAALEHFNALPEPKKSGFRYLQISTDEVYGSL
ncbi:MAG: GDP-mannose 4,6-dehydratase, partial [Oligoflexia bacterium]|nr:GDP-mannose 4,6-dehydratase [Oligoflexia bacterium]